MMAIRRFPWLWKIKLRTVHDAGIGISKANPRQFGKFILEDGKVLTLAQKSSPSKNCINADQPCGLLHWCCEGRFIAMVILMEDV
ncbi:hypothetical protein CTI12_AA285320 [Artemisia annua]|uniref:Uncharacterized protein n=1 Tax=Artemisia annua TaxID=35608 RepID=A0A2U1NBF9_ARTAN|nr:hypothetical protein CTI12_AA285320 [Artemisia annua]